MIVTIRVSYNKFHFVQEISKGVVRGSNLTKQRISPTRDPAEETQASAGFETHHPCQKVSKGQWMGVAHD